MSLAEATSPISDAHTLGAGLSLCPCVLGDPGGQITCSYMSSGQFPLQLTDIPFIPFFSRHLEYTRSLAAPSAWNSASAFVAFSRGFQGSGPQPSPSSRFAPGEASAHSFFSNYLNADGSLQGAFENCMSMVSPTPDCIVLGTSESTLLSLSSVTSAPCAAAPCPWPPAPGMDREDSRLLVQPPVLISNSSSLPMP